MSQVLFDKLDYFVEHPKFGEMPAGLYFVDLSEWNGEEHNREYTSTFNGTSSATPLVAGSLALIQSNMIQKHGIYLDYFHLLKAINIVAYKEAEDNKIGYRPNVMKTIQLLDEM